MPQPFITLFVGVGLCVALGGCPPNAPVTPGVVPGEMVSLLAGSFQMGDPWDEGQLRERPVHTVTLSAYLIGKYEVTNQEYADILNWANGRGDLTTASSSTASAFGQELLDVDSPHCQIRYSGGQFLVKAKGGYSMADHPVVQVSWYGAAAYCNWLSERQGLQLRYNTSTWASDLLNNGYHLPTEAQWERAASWGERSGHNRYGNGSNSISCANANYVSGSGFCNPLGLSSKPYTSPVGYYSEASSPAGCYDMCGNVFEWCNDRWYRMYTLDAVTDPEGPGTGENRVQRGGSWSNGASYCRSAFRDVNHVGTTAEHIGFRVAR